MTETGYGLGESLISTIIQSVTGFSSVNVTRADFSKLNKGKAAVYAILVQGQPGQRTGRQQVTEPWLTQVQIWRRYIDDGTTAVALYADVDKVLLAIEKYPHLGDTSGYVVDSEPSLSAPPEEMWARGGGPAWLRQTITVRWTGQRLRTFLD